MLSQCFRRFINTKPAKRSKVKLPVHTPNCAVGPILLDNGCTFVELKPSTVSDVSKSVSHFPSPPVLKNYAGQVVSQSCIAEMKQLRSVHPEKWTVTQLAKKYQVSRSFVISNVFSAEEREKFKGEIDEMITNMSIKQQRGWILRHMIRSDRQASW